MGVIPMQIHKKSALAIGALIILALCFLVYFYAGHYFSLGALQQKSLYLRESVSVHYTAVLTLYTLLYTLSIVVGIPGIGPFTLLGGFLFGAIPALLASLVAITVGITSSFLIMRYFFAQTLGQKFAQKKVKFAERMQRYGPTYLITLNLLTIVPFFVINSLAVLSGVSVWTTVWTSIVGSIPMLIVYACAGKQFAEISSMRDLFSPQLIAAFIILILLSLIPLAIKRMNYGNDL
jgi:uncharacterized membrane protein YdjX (TVP38/TMEM64 family)